MTLRARSEVRILASAGFRRARMQAAVTSQSSAAMRELLASVDLFQIAGQPALSLPARLDLDILCAVVDARAESLAPNLPEQVDALTITAAARLNLVVATLLYVTGSARTDPTMHPEPEEIAALLRWATRAAYQQLPVSS